VFGQQIDLVEHFDARLGQTFELIENFFHLSFLFVAVGGGGVTDVEQHLGLCDFFKRSAEAGDQRVRQIADETDRIGKQNAAAAGQLNRS